jgi:hypothetical protein
LQLVCRCRRTFIDLPATAVLYSVVMSHIYLAVLSFIHFTALKIPPSHALSRGIPCLVLLAYLMLALQPDLRLAVPEMLAATAVITMLLAAALYCGEKLRLSWSPTMILAIAAVARLLFLFRSPELSDDIYRYLWDGLCLLGGCNPYAAAPAAVQVTAGALVELQRLVNHSGLVTIYPPAAQLVFAAGALTGGGVLGIKALLVLLDLGSCLLILRLLATFRLPAWMAALYAWHPLPVLEVGASGHIDAAGIFFVLATLCLLAGPPGADCNSLQPESANRVSSRWVHFPPAFMAGATFACAVLVKLLPLVFLPGLLIALRRRRFAFLLGTGLAGVALTMPFLPELVNGLATLRTYAGNWEFAGFLFRSLREVTGSGDIARMILAVLFLGAVVFWYGHQALAGHRKDILIGNAGLLAAVRACAGAVTCFLLLTPTLHPWYALYLAAFLPFAASPARLVLCWSVFLGYRVLIASAILGQWVEDDLTPMMITLAPIAAFCAGFLLLRMKSPLR